ncbi:L-serine ammonia-lyase [Succinatimonas hippei]|uniref:L-serine dehydratase n=1 Tax=Succinatimonas hippei (strain DSM 22608 / JCM 16073 / KCTC 15190 / YIT 12066) TaxID=762983 RepID=E8LJ90_SUCHY|nr:L-serine ammonia-lyase [Succinatimonas hippei]EFY07420.1 L-serine ammonia-lyase [Succinatimonas hippei YIT 12066]
MQSNLSIFKIGIGPSSSHTLGPLFAGNMFCKKIHDVLDKTAKIKITLFGSLSLTGIGHLSDKAVIWGLCGISPKDLDAKLQEEIIDRVINERKIKLCGIKDIDFNYKEDLVFSSEFLPLHENALTIKALDEKGDVLAEETYYSVGGGFIKVEADFYKKEQDTDPLIIDKKDFMPISNTEQALNLCKEHGWNLAKLSLEFEKQFHDEKYIKDYCLEIWETMQQVYYNGSHCKSDYLPGALHLKRRGKELYQRLTITADPLGIIDYVSLYAFCIAEENAAGAKVVTAPTNGACAVVPAVMLYLKNHAIGFNDDKVVEFLLSAMLIGSFYKKNASISGAEAGCQAEIGAASSMAAGAMATVLGAEASVACSAAEVSMEHHLGLTCDPVDGLVQIPCIERNAFGALQAISAARISMSRLSQPRVSLDQVISTMYATGKDMNQKYKETSLGGLAIAFNSIC